LAARLRADSADEVWERLGTMASDLSAGHADEFLNAFDPAMPSYAELRKNVTALLAQAEVQCSIEIESNDGDDQKRTVDVTWLLRILRNDDISGAIKREERVKVGFAKSGKRWRAVSLAPLEFFAPVPAN
jgi:hypothetical protein